MHAICHILLPLPTVIHNDLPHNDGGPVTYLGAWTSINILLLSPSLSQMMDICRSSKRKKTLGYRHEAWLHISAPTAKYI